MKTLGFIICLLAVGCGKTYQVDSDFQPYVDEFQAASKGPAHADNLIIEYGEASSKSAGATCYHQALKTPRIAVDRDTWKVLSEDGRKSILFHEMGHCVLDREHRSDTGEANCPVSLMAPNKVSEWCINHFGWDFYNQEMFK